MTASDRGDPTIAAIATPPGPGGVGIIRISGDRALAILKQLFRLRSLQSTENMASHKMHYGWIVDPETRLAVDEVLAVYMRAPATYTREDVVEIHCHGSFLVLQEVLALVIGAGAVHAAPGEFTKRAFLNGRIDLTQAEAVLDILQAKTKEGLQMAMGQLQGGLHENVAAIRDGLLSVRAILEVAIDFPEEDVEILKPDELRDTLLHQVKVPLEELLAATERGKIFRDGISAVILGRPNVGKSSLLNSLLREERAIVTAIPGTTRDTIEEYLDIQGMPVRMVDTAGIREVAEAVEEIGIQRARKKLAAADLVLFMVDGSEPLTDADLHIFEAITGKPMLLVVNKIDIAPGWGAEPFADAFPGISLVAISTRTGQGLKELEQAVFDAVTGGAVQWDPSHGAAAPNLRHKTSLRKGLESLSLVFAGLEDGLPPDLLAVELQAVLAHLGDIVGETTAEDVLDKIFEGFCIGK